jgi:hypothetical protein
MYQIKTTKTFEKNYTKHYLITSADVNMRRRELFFMLMSFE